MTFTQFMLDSEANAKTITNIAANVLNTVPIRAVKNVTCNIAAYTVGPVMVWTGPPVKKCWGWLEKMASDPVVIPAK